MELRSFRPFRRRGGLLAPALVGPFAALALLHMAARASVAQAAAPLVRRHLTQTTNPPRLGELTFNSLRESRYWDVSLMDVATGTVRRISRHTSSGKACAWSPDGSRLAFMTNRDGNFEIYTMDSNGGDWRRITNTRADDWEPEWSPDGRHIAYAEDVGGDIAELFVVSPDGSNRAQLTSDPAGAYAPRWSPDGTRIAYVSGTELKVMNGDGTDPVSLISDSDETSTCDWSPSGSHILFMSKRTGVYKLYTYRLADGAIEAIPTGDYDAWSGRWSPDGSLIAFYSYGTAGDGPNGMPAVIVMSSDGSNLRQVTTLTPNDLSYYPIWRP
jgi:Tol biopolymer transport system component